MIPSISTNQTDQNCYQKHSPNNINADNPQTGNTNNQPNKDNN